MSTTFDVDFLRVAMGLRVLMVDDLAQPVIYLRRYRVALLSANLPEDQTRAILERLFVAECGASHEETGDTEAGR